MHVLQSSPGRLDAKSPVDKPEGGHPAVLASKTKEKAEYQKAACRLCDAIDVASQATPEPSLKSMPLASTATLLILQKHPYHFHQEFRLLLYFMCLLHIGVLDQVTRGWYLNLLYSSWVYWTITALGDLSE